jgi:hypothetical protein
MESNVRSGVKFNLEEKSLTVDRSKYENANCSTETLQFNFSFVDSRHLFYSRARPLSMNSYYFAASVRSRRVITPLWIN